MKTLLIIAPEPALASAIRATLDPARYRILHQTDLREDEFLLTPSSIDICILDVELNTIEPIRLIQRVRRCLAHCPVILYATASQWEWEEDAYLLGVNHILTKPVRGRLLSALLERLGPVTPPPPERHSPEARSRFEPKPAADPNPVPVRMLELLRNCSSILMHSLCAESLLKEFLLLLREIIGVNRAALFLREPPGSLADNFSLESARRLRATYAIGLAPGLLEHFELSLQAGIGGHVFRFGRIVRRDSEEADRDPQMRKEFELLSGEVAIPILDRESFLGVAIFDGRVTGELLGNEELALIFHLLEQLGMAVRNIWLHDQIAANHEMMSNILRQLSSACVVVGRDLSVLHANDAARSFFHRGGTKNFEFTDLPRTLCSKVFEVLKTGKAVAPYKYQWAEAPDKTFQVSITPFQKRNADSPTAALLLVEDFSHVDRLQRLEIEMSNLRMVKQMAERVAHEIGNAVVPISTHEQLLKERIEDPEFQESLRNAMQEGVKRVTRLLDQMRFLARDKVDLTEQVQVHQLIDEAFREARIYHPSSSALLRFESTGEPLTLTGDRVGLQHAFLEIILNALQASASSGQVQVRARVDTDAEGVRWAQIDVVDSGAGFSPEMAGKVPEPFCSTRNVGLGLGLVVCNKIIQTHRGHLDIPTPAAGKSGLVRVTLPMSQTAQRPTEET